MFKRLVGITLAGALAFSLCACGGAARDETQAETKAETAAETQTETEAETTEAQTEEIAMVGGWTNHASEGARLSDEDQEIFDTAVADYEGGELRAIALLGTQVVAGENFCYLVQNGIDESAEYDLAFIYVDLSGNVSLLDVVALDYTADSFGETESGQLAGGWTVASDTFANPSRDIIEVLDAAQEDVTDSEYVLIANLGTQVVAGTNYKMLCYESTGDDSAKTLQMLTVYENLDGTVTISDVQPFSIANFR